MAEILLPPLPDPDNKYGFNDWIRARDDEVVRLVLEGAAKVCLSLAEANGNLFPICTSAQIGCAEAMGTMKVKHHE